MSLHSRSPLSPHGSGPLSSSTSPTYSTSGHTHNTYTPSNRNQSSTNSTGTGLSTSSFSPSSLVHSSSLSSLSPHSHSSSPLSPSSHSTSPHISLLADAEAARSRESSISIGSSFEIAQRGQRASDSSNSGPLLPIGAAPTPNRERDTANIDLRRIRTQNNQKQSMVHVISQYAPIVCFSLFLLFLMSVWFDSSWLSWELLSFRSPPPSNLNFHYQHSTNYQPYTNFLLTHGAILHERECSQHDVISQLSYFSRYSIHHTHWAIVLTQSNYPTQKFYNLMKMQPDITFLVLQTTSITKENWVTEEIRARKSWIEVDLDNVVYLCLQQQLSFSASSSRFLYDTIKNSNPILPYVAMGLIKNHGIIIALRHGAQVLWELDERLGMWGALPENESFLEDEMEMGDIKHHSHDSTYNRYSSASKHMRWDHVEIDGRGSGVGFNYLIPERVSSSLVVPLSNQTMWNPFHHFGEPSVVPRGWPSVPFGSVMSTRPYIPPPTTQSHTYSRYHPHPPSGTLPCIIPYGTLKAAVQVYMIENENYVIPASSFENGLNIKHISDSRIASLKKLNSPLLHENAPPVALDIGSLMPFGADHTLWYYSSIFLMVTPAFKGICSDILRSYFAQRILWDMEQHVLVMGQNLQRKTVKTPTAHLKSKSDDQEYLSFSSFTASHQHMDSCSYLVTPDFVANVLSFQWRKNKKYYMNAANLEAQAAAAAAPPAKPNDRTGHVKPMFEEKDDMFFPAASTATDTDNAADYEGDIDFLSVYLDLWLTASDEWYMLHPEDISVIKHFMADLKQVYYQVPSFTHAQFKAYPAHRKAQLRGKNDANLIQPSGSLREYQNCDGKSSKQRYDGDKSNACPVDHFTWDTKV